MALVYLWLHSCPLHHIPLFVPSFLFLSYTEPTYMNEQYDTIAVRIKIQNKSSGSGGGAIRTRQCPWRMRQTMIGQI